MILLARLNSSITETRYSMHALVDNCGVTKTNGVLNAGIGCDKVYCTVLANQIVY